ncbi:MAG: hypothetical protein HY965_01265 [Ignavibacteriales bacterium]|nr:hypothetical protein [Ignavibacteriales bacterium]
MKNNIILSVIVFFLLIAGCKEKTRIVSAVEDGKELPEGTPLTLYLEQNYPNPCNGSTEIYFAVGKKMHVTIKVYTEDWVKIKTVRDEVLQAGRYHAIFSARNSNNKLLPSGDYYYTLEGDGVTLVRKMKIIK